MSGCWGDQIDRAVEARHADAVALRRHLHAHPEASGAEQATSQHLARQLTEAGCRVRFGPEGRGLIVDPLEGPPAPCAAIRADIDALRIQDAKQVAYASQTPSVMHACGHDAHTAAAVTAILAIKDVTAAGELPWPVRWRGIFQPAEETSRGAHEMIAAGAMQGVSAIFALHVDPSRRTGDIGVRAGALTAACDELEVVIEGRGGHAARPHESIDPIAAAAQLISSIYLFVPRATDSQDPVVVTIGQVVGGDNPNVIPERVALYGTLRTLGGQVRERTKDHIRQLARGLAQASGARIQVEFRDGPASVQNDRELTALVRDIGEQLLGAEHVARIARPSMGGEDFSHYLQYAPGTMFRLGSSSEEGAAPLHSPLFDLDERALSIGAKILARAAVAWSDPRRRREEKRT